MSYTHSKRKLKRRRKQTLKSQSGVSPSSKNAALRIDDSDSIDSKMTPSSGNVFLDIGFPPQEASELIIRADLMIQISEMIRRRKLTQAKAAKLFGVSQPRISDLTRGKIDLFSIDGLVAMLGHAGMSVTFHVKSAA